MKTTIKDEVNEYDFAERTKNVWRHIEVEIPLPMAAIVNKGLPKDTISDNDINPEQEYCRQIEVQNDKIIINLDYWYEAKASDAELKKEIKRMAVDKISNLRENLKMLCDKCEVSMDEMLELTRTFVKENKES